MRIDYIPYSLRPDISLQMKADSWLKGNTRVGLPLTDLPSVNSLLNPSRITINPTAPLVKPVPTPSAPIVNPTPATPIAAPVPAAPLPTPPVAGGPASIPTDSIKLAQQMSSFDKMMAGVKALSPLAASVVNTIKQNPVPWTIGLFLFGGLWHHSKVREVRNINITLKADAFETLAKQITVGYGNSKTRLKVVAAPGQNMQIDLDHGIDFPAVIHLKIVREGVKSHRVDVFPLGEEQVLRIEQ